MSVVPSCSEPILTKTPSGLWGLALCPVPRGIHTVSPGPLPVPVPEPGRASCLGLLGAGVHGFGFTKIQVFNFSI